MFAQLLIYLSMHHTFAMCSEWQQVDTLLPCDGSLGCYEASYTEYMA